MEKQETNYVNNLSTLDVEEISSWIQKSDSFLALLRNLRQESESSLSKRTGVQVGVIMGIEAGEVLPSQDQLTKIARGYRIDPRDIDEEYFYDDPKDRMKGGKNKDRDKRFGKSDEFWIWFHRRIKPQNPKRDRTNLTKPEVDELEDEWKKLGCPVPKELTLPI